MSEETTADYKITVSAPKFRAEDQDLPSDYMEITNYGSRVLIECCDAAICNGRETAMVDLSRDKAKALAWWLYEQLLMEETDKE